jgi:hypothetical protein
MLAFAIRRTRDSIRHMNTSIQADLVMRPLSARIDAMPALDF